MNFSMWAAVFEKCIGSYTTNALISPWRGGRGLIREGAYLKFFDKDRITLCLWSLKSFAALITNMNSCIIYNELTALISN